MPDLDACRELLEDALPGLGLFQDAGHGGQSRVLVAHHPSHGLVAIKLLVQGPLYTDADRLRFEREIDILRRMDNEHVVPIIDHGMVGDEPECVPYFIMPLIEGQTIHEYCHIMYEPTVRECVGLFLQVCDGLAHAHAKGVIHRDIKPGNIMVSDEGHVSILDFGLSSACGTVHITTVACIIGTPAWTAPEQLCGALPDVRVDVHGLGLVMFNMLSRQMPYDVDGGTRVAHTNILTKEPRRLRDMQPSVDRDLAAVIDKCIRKEPSARYRSMNELCDDLKRWQCGAAVHVRSDDRRYRRNKWAQAHKWPLIAASIFIVTLLAGMTSTTIMWQRAEQATYVARTELQVGGLITMGSVERDAGRIEDALEMWKDAATLCEPLGVHNDSVAALQFKALQRLAELEYHENMFEDAERHSAQAIAIAESLFLSDPEDDKLARLLGFAYKLRGKMAFAAEDWEGAERSYRRSLTIREQLAREHGEPSLRAELAKVYAALGRTSRRLDRTAAAHEYYRSEYEMYAGLAAQHSEAADYPIGLAFACTHLSSWCINQDSVSSDMEAAKYLREAEAQVAAALIVDVSRIRDARRIREVISQHSGILSKRHKGH